MVAIVAGEVACAACGTRNPERARFCMSCGGTLASACGQCGTENPPGAKFCIECGNGLGGPAPPADAGAVPAGAPAAPIRPDLAPPGAAAGLPEERRKATVLFADLSGYTAVA